MTAQGRARVAVNLLRTASLLRLKLAAAAAAAASMKSVCVNQGRSAAA